MVTELGLDAARPVTTPGCREDVVKAAKDSATSQLLTGKEATRFRAVVATLNYLAQDRPDLLYSTKEVS